MDCPGTWEVSKKVMKKTEHKAVMKSETSPLPLLHTDLMLSQLITPMDCLAFSVTESIKISLKHI
jgi:hypothetical protein